MSLFKHIILLIVPLLATQIYGSSFDTKIFNQKQPENIILIKNNDLINKKLIIHGNIKNTNLLSNEIKNTLNNNNDLINKKLNGLKIDAWLYKNSPQVSFSNASKNCEINISYAEDMPKFLLDDIKKDIDFVTIHEIGHCILGKEIFNNNIHWEYSISNEQQNLIKNIIKKQTNAGIKIKNHEAEIVEPLPIIIYHEMFADTFAAIWLYNHNIINLSDIQNVAKERKIQYFVKQEKTAYLSFLPLYEYMNMINNKSIEKTVNIDETIQLTTLIVQKNFIQYLMNSQ